MQSSGSIGLCLVWQTRPLCIASYAISVRQTGSLPVSALHCLHIRLPSDSTSRWTPLPSANSSYCQVCSGLSPPSYCPCRAHPKKRGRCRIKNCSAPFFVFQREAGDRENEEKDGVFHKKGRKSPDPGAFPASNVENYFVFSAQTVIFSDTRVCSLPCSRFIQYFFRSKAMARRNNSARMFALPRVRNL